LEEKEDEKGLQMHDSDIDDDCHVNDDSEDDCHDDDSSSSSSNTL
jgi:hypothetical protein